MRTSYNVAEVKRNQSVALAALPAELRRDPERYEPFALDVEFVSLPSGGKSTALRRVKLSLDESGVPARIVANQEDSDGYLPGLKELFTGTPYSRTFFFANRFLLSVAQVEERRCSGGVVLIEHFVGFTEAFEGFGRGGKCGDIARAVLKDVREPGLTLYLDTDPLTAYGRGQGAYERDLDFLTRMYEGLELLAEERRWHRIRTTGRSTDDLASECFEAVVQKLRGSVLAMASSSNTMNSRTRFGDGNSTVDRHQ